MAGALSQEALADLLPALPLFEKLSPEQAGWVAARGEVRQVRAGEGLFAEGASEPGFHVLIEGEIELLKRIAGEDVSLRRSASPGAWAAAIPLADDVTQFSARAVRDSTLFVLPDAAAREMLLLGFPIAHHLLRGVRTGSHEFEAWVQSRDRLTALGKLSAGLAHELNNPAAAAGRATAQLKQSVERLAARALALRQLQPEHASRLAEARAGLRQAAKPPAADALERSDLEDALASWLEERSVADAWDLAPALAGAGVDTEWLARTWNGFEPGELQAAVQWLADELTVAELLDEIEDSSSRISALVAAIKDYSHMDQAPLQEVDVHRGLESTITMLAYELRGITLTRQYDTSLPNIQAYASELNQVWTNLLDNASDALQGKGAIVVRTSRDGECIEVDITDDGPGIPEDIRDRIFEPFFTTKSMGEGTGLGLDVVYRIVVRRHHGDVRVTSRPGETSFQVRLPLAPPAAPDQGSMR